MRDSGVLRRLPDAACYFIHDDIVVGRISAQQTSDAEYRIVLFCFGEHAGGGGNFKRTWDANQHDIFFLGARAEQAVVGALKKPFRNEGVEARDHDRESLPRSVEPAFDGGKRRFRNFVDFQFFVQKSLCFFGPAVVDALDSSTLKRRGSFL